MNLFLPEVLPEEFAEPLARAVPRLGPFAREIIWYPSVSSTSDAAAVLAERGGAEGLVVVANAQTAGRGRFGRGWSSPPGAGLYVSVILRPKVEVVPMVTIAAGVAVAEGIQKATGLRCALKWPNDLYVGVRKVAGILAEATTTTGDMAAVQYLVLGFGINVMPANYPPEVAVRATSLEEELGRGVDRALVLAESLVALAQRYADLGQGRSPAVIAEWRVRALMTFGRRVRLESAGAPLEGVVEDIDEAGALIVQTASGALRVTSGEVSWI
jgi:BirA family biotin operon repressor/biotin-[acetyl-CoA-carboxylase] ligase